MESLKDNMTNTSDEFEINNMANAEEFSPAIQQQDSGIHKVSFSSSPFFEYVYSFSMKDNTGTYLFRYNNNIRSVIPQLGSGGCRMYADLTPLSLWDREAVSDLVIFSSDR